MHIPDGYLSPETCLALYGAAAPFWYRASKSVKRVLSGRAAPMLAILAAFSFTIQMFNIPVPGGTSAHAVGGTLVAIVLGPSAAIVGVSVALVIQALFFGDGGITALGANAFNMAIALPLTGYAVYRLLAGGPKSSDRRRVISAAIGSYLGINVAGLLVASELGLQPVLWHEGGHALYNPYGLSVTIPAIVFTHLTIAGFAEAALTALAVAYLLRGHRSLLLTERPAPPVQVTQHSSLPTGWLAALAALVVLVPLGLFASGTAAFEWGSDQVRDLVGYVPSGLASLERFWHFSLFPGYQGGSPARGADVLSMALTYILSAILGIGLIFVATFSARLVLNRQRVHDGRRE